MWLPNEINKYVEGMKYKENHIGWTKAKVYEFYGNGEIYFLKVDTPSAEFNREQQMYRWLEGKLPVPKVISVCSANGFEYLLINKAKGELAEDNKYLNNSEMLVKLLAEGILKLQKVNIADCPFDSSIEYKLEKAKERIDRGLVNFEHCGYSNGFNSPMEIYEYLQKNKPIEECVFIHGDYCLPNIFFDEYNVSSYIDLGRAGVGDRWQDIALCIRTLEKIYQSNKYSNMLFKYLNLEPNYEKISYYILLDELF